MQISMKRLKRHKGILGFFIEATGSCPVVVHLLDFHFWHDNVIS
jgi:hypothetical protein